MLTMPLTLTTSDEVRKAFYPVKPRLLCFLARVFEHGLNGVLKVCPCHRPETVPVKNPQLFIKSILLSLSLVFKSIFAERNLENRHSVVFVVGVNVGNQTYLPTMKAFEPKQTTMKIDIHEYLSPSARQPGQDPSKFGPHLWHVLHVLSHQGPCCSSLGRLATSMARVLMCIYCRRSMQAFLMAHPFNYYCSKEDGWATFFNHLHNWVNLKLGKRSWSVEESSSIYGVSVYNEWETFRESLYKLLLLFVAHVPAEIDGWMRHEKMRRDFREAIDALVGAILNVERLVPLGKRLKEGKVSELLSQVSVHQAMSEFKITL